MRDLDTVRQDSTHFDTPKEAAHTRKEGQAARCIAHTPKEGRAARCPPPHAQGRRLHHFNCLYPQKVL